MSSTVGTILRIIITPSFNMDYNTLENKFANIQTIWEQTKRIGILVSSLLVH